MADDSLIDFDMEQFLDQEMAMMVDPGGNVATSSRFANVDD
jgi:hypothetical protein